MPCLKNPILIARSKSLKSPLVEVRNDAASGRASDHGRAASIEAGGWANMLPELLREIIRRVDESDTSWPERKNVVACACVCTRWREITKELVFSSSRRSSGVLTFPSCLKQPGSRAFPHQCLIRRDKSTGTFYLYLCLSPLAFTERGKFLLAAKRFRHGTRTDYIISLNADDISPRSNAYVGKLSSDIFGTNFTIYDSEPPHSGAKPSSSKFTRRFTNKQISPQVPAGTFDVGRVSYKFNLLKSRGPRRMTCSVKCPYPVSGERTQNGNCTILKNKTPRWHEHLQCWCLNFHGRVTVASVKNFQLVATVDQSLPGGKGDEEAVLLQFGKVGDDVFTMDFKQPLSAFLSFAICLTSFGSKFACE